MDDASLATGLSVARLIRVRFPTLRILGLAIASDSRRVLECAEAGLAGFLGSDVGIEGLVVAVEQIMRGELSRSPRVAGLLFERLATLAESHRGEAPALAVSKQGDQMLTPRETEVARLIDAGLTNKEIALNLRISAATVKNHVDNILEKLAAPRRDQRVPVERWESQLAALTEA